MIFTIGTPGPNRKALQGSRALNDHTKSAGSQKLIGEEIPMPDEDPS